jgi:flavin reductase (DIM6/NTAB) family NADH-FMN oxidoreductase RutF
VTIDRDEFRRVMGHFASGVTVVTTHYEQVDYGMTVSSFASLSLHPPLVLVCVDHKVVSHKAIQGAGFFAVNILNESGEFLSRRFATREIDRFKGIAFHTGLTGAPLLEGVLAALECQVVDQAVGGDHTIFMGKVIAATTYPGKPLLYYRGGYHQLA